MIRFCRQCLVKFFMISGIHSKHSRYHFFINFISLFRYPIERSLYFCSLAIFFILFFSFFYFYNYYPFRNLLVFDIELFIFVKNSDLFLLFSFSVKIRYQAENVLLLEKKKINAFYYFSRFKCCNL